MRHDLDRSHDLTYKIPVGTVVCDGDVRFAAIDDVVAIGVNGVVHTLAKHLDVCDGTGQGMVWENAVRKGCEEADQSGGEMIKSQVRLGVSDGGSMTYCSGSPGRKWWASLLPTDPPPNDRQSLSTDPPPRYKCFCSLPTAH